MKKNSRSKALLLLLISCFMIMASACNDQEEETSVEEVTLPEEKNILGSVMISVNPEMLMHYDIEGNIQETEGKNKEAKKVNEQLEYSPGQHGTEVAVYIVDAIQEAGYFESEEGEGKKNLVVRLAKGSDEPYDTYLEEIVQAIENRLGELGEDSQVIGIREEDLTEEGYLNESIAKDLIIHQFSLDADEVDFLEMDQNLDDLLYEFAFYYQDEFHEVELDAYTGKIQEANRASNDDWQEVDEILAEEARLGTQVGRNLGGQMEPDQAEETQAGTGGQADQGNQSEQQDQPGQVNQTGQGNEANTVQVPNQGGEEVVGLTPRQTGRANNTTTTGGNTGASTNEAGQRGPGANTSSTASSSSSRPVQSSNSQARSTTSSPPVENPPSSEPAPAPKPASTPSPAPAPTQEPGQAKEITSARAQEIALNHAGVSSSQIVGGIEIEKDEDDGKLVWEVEFNTASHEYDYEIDAISGSILNFEKDTTD